MTSGTGGICAGWAVLLLGWFFGASRRRMPWPINASRSSSAMALTPRHPVCLTPHVMRTMWRRGPHAPNCGGVGGGTRQNSALSAPPTTSSLCSSREPQRSTPHTNPTDISYPPNPTLLPPPLALPSTLPHRRPPLSDDATHPPTPPPPPPPPAGRAGGGRPPPGHPLHRFRATPQEQAGVGPPPPHRAHHVGG